MRLLVRQATNSKTRDLETRNYYLDRSCVSPNQAAHYALDLDALRGLDEDRFELWIGRLEANELWLAVKLLHRRIISINQRYYHLSVLRRPLRRDDNGVAILNIFLNH